MLAGKKVLLCLTGGIAAYKGAEICRMLVREEALVKVVMTRNACAFITPLTLQTLSGSKVYTETFGSDNYQVDHVSLARWADALLVAPATANVIGKMAHGIADDLLTTLLLARGRTPVLLAPAMNCEMYEAEALQENLKTLKLRGVKMVEPGWGALACGTSGVGRMAEPGEALKALKELFQAAEDFRGLKVMVTAGPTREPLDPVRFFSNHSSGKMGFALARAARDRGGEVLLIAGPTSLAVPPGLTYRGVETAAQMYGEVLKEAPGMDVIIKAAAVADYRPGRVSTDKIKKKDAALTVSLERNPDILEALGKAKAPGQILVGFAAETRDLLENALDKLKAKNLDLIAANDVSRPDIGFDRDHNALTLLYPGGEREEVPFGEKDAVAHGLLNAIMKLKNRP